MIITLPGIGNSGPEHWQTFWERDFADTTRFSPASWHSPFLDDWIFSLEGAVATAKVPPLLVAHSLACLLVAHWASRSRCHVAGAFLVSVPDPAAAPFPQAAASFAGPPSTPLPFPSLMVSSDDDPFGSVAYRGRVAESWGAGQVLLGSLGHINDQSALGHWPQGKALLRAFAAGLRVRL